MHVPDKFKETNTEILHGLICSHPLGTWITTKNDDLEVNHIPFVLDTSQGEYGVLRGHVSIANPVWKSLPTLKESIVVFQGAETYISPSWYPSKQEHGKAVPTWNYVVVHAHGHAKYISDKDWLLEHLNVLTNLQESSTHLQKSSTHLKQSVQSEPWQVSDAPTDFIEKMLGAIIGIEIPISTLTGAWKTSQNKTDSDKTGVINGLKSSGNSQSIEMASYISKHIP